LVAVSVAHATPRCALGLEVAARAPARVKPRRPTSASFGLYATLNAEHLFGHSVDSVIGGRGGGRRCGALIEALERGDSGPVPGVGRPGPGPPAPHLRRARLSRLPSRAGLPSIKKVTRTSERDGPHGAGRLRGSRAAGGLHRCRHCPIPPVYGGALSSRCPREIRAGPTCASQIERGGARRHVTFGDPDFLNGPTPRPSRWARDPPRRVARRHLRLHGQDRAPAAPTARHLVRAAGGGLPLSWVSAAEFA